MGLRSGRTVITRIDRMTGNTLSTMITSSHNMAMSGVARLHGTNHRTNMCVHIIHGALLHHTIRNAPFRYLGSTFINPALVTCSVRRPNTTTHLFGRFTGTGTGFRIGTTTFRNRLVPTSRVSHLTALPACRRTVTHLVTAVGRTSTNGLIHALTTMHSTGRTTWSRLSFWHVHLHVGLF